MSCFGLLGCGFMLCFGLLVYVCFGLPWLVGFGITLVALVVVRFGLLAASFWVWLMFGWLLTVFVYCVAFVWTCAGLICLRSCIGLLCLYCCRLLVRLCWLLLIVCTTGYFG